MKLTSNEYKRAFIISEVGADVKKQLVMMENDRGYVTNSSYTPTSEVNITFTDKHFTYLSQNQQVKPLEYMANLRLKTRKR
jgi:hypothetical protein